MGWPIFFKDELKLGDTDNNIGICTLWTRKGIIYNKLKDNSYAVCGNLYTIQGINSMIKNVLAKPNIRYIILCGKDLMGSGRGLLKLIENGVDENRKIIGSSGFIDSSIDLDLLERFRKGVEVIDLRERGGELEERIKNLEKKGPFAKPVFITEEDKTIADLQSEEIGVKVVGKNIANGWLKILDVVMKFGEEKESEYKLKQKEVLNIVTIIEDDDVGLEPWLNINEKDIENYYVTFFGEEKNKDLSYTYGERLFKYSLPHVGEKAKEEAVITFNQIDDVINRLKRTPFSRRAVASTWKVGIDRKTKSPPCLTQITWNIKFGRLYQTAIFRSHDIFGAWPLNLFALRKLQNDISNRLGIEVGSLTVLSNSAHIYDSNWNKAKEILNKYYHGGFVKYEEDKNGYFIISIENGEVVVQHRLPDGRKTDFVFRGKNSEILYRQILHENLISRLDHAAYVGKELGGAEIALKESKKYVQDKA